MKSNNLLNIYILFSNNILNYQKLIDLFGIY